MASNLSSATLAASGACNAIFHSLMKQSCDPLANKSAGRTTVAYFPEWNGASGPSKQNNQGLTLVVENQDAKSNTRVCGWLLFCLVVNCSLILIFWSFQLEVYTVLHGESGLQVKIEQILSEAIFIGLKCSFS